MPTANIIHCNGPTSTCTSVIATTLSAHRDYHVSESDCLLGQLNGILTLLTITTWSPSWFGIHHSVPNWFRCLSPTFHVALSVSNAIITSLPCLVLVKAPPLFIMYTTIPISSVSLNHHLYADDTHTTQTWLNCQSLSECHATWCLQIFLFLTLLILNFTLLDSKGNFPKYTAHHSLCTQSSFLFFMNTFPSLIRSHHFQNPAIVTRMNFPVSVVTVISFTVSPSWLLYYNLPKSLQVAMCYISFFLTNLLTYFNTRKLPPIYPELSGMYKVINFFISFLSSNYFTCSWLINALHVSLSLQITNHSFQHATRKISSVRQPHPVHSTSPHHSPCPQYLSLSFHA